MVTRHRSGTAGLVVLTACLIVGQRSIGIGQPAENEPDPAILQVLEDLRDEVDTLAAGVVPSRTIVAWYPDKTEDGFLVPPDGWIICDGDDGTPDLRNRFIYGTDSFDEVGDEGGAREHSHSMSQGPQQRRFENDDGHWASASDHTHSVHPTSSLPPLVKMVYIMKR